MKPLLSFRAALIVSLVLTNFDGSLALAAEPAKKPQVAASAGAKRRPASKTAKKAATPAPETGIPKAKPITKAEGQDVEQLKTKLKENEDKIKATEAEIKRIKDSDFLVNLYFALADLYVEKSRLLYLIKVESNPGTPVNELDFTAEKRPKQTAVEIYQKVYIFFTNFERRDRALFYKAHEHRDLGQVDLMSATYVQLMKEFPDSPYWLETNLIMGDFLFEEKKDVDGALEYYKRVISKPISPYSAVAHYRMGWCFVNKFDFPSAFKSFESALDVYDKVDRSLLPETYKKTDLRRESVLALVNPYTELYADHEKKHLLPPETPVEYFRRRADAFLTYQKALARLGRRLTIKNLWKESAEAHLKLATLSDDPTAKLDAALRFHEAIRKGKLAATADWVEFQKQAGLIVNDLRTLDVFSAQEKGKREKHFEIVMRDIATMLHAQARDSKSTQVYNWAFQAYEDYEWAFPKSKFLALMYVNKAESAFSAGRWVEAGVAYERLSKLKPSNKKRSELQKDFAESAMQAYIKALEGRKDLSATHLLQARSGLRSVSVAWLAKNARHPGAASVMYNVAQSYYDEREFSSAIKSVEQFIRTYPQDDKVSAAVGMAINSYSQMDDYQNLVKAGEKYLKISGLKEEDRESIRSTIRAAQLKQIQAKAGEFGSKEYAQNLKAIAAQNKGTELGDQALYEAFISMRSKRDPQSYEMGELLLKNHGDSRYTKEVVASMAQIALVTADFERAARYFEVFSIKYPQEKESVAWMRNSAGMYEWLGEYAKARGLFARLGDQEAAARMDRLAGDWPSLEKSAKTVGGLTGTYWQALALTRQGRQREANGMLQQIAQQKASDESRDIIAHATYLLSTDTLAKFRAMRMSDANDQAALQSAVQIYQDLTAQLKQVIALQSGRWTIAALYGLGQANYNLAQFIVKTPIPAGLSAAEVGQYKAELKKQAVNYGTESRKYFKQCLSTAEQFEVLTRFVDGCLANGKTEVSEADDTLIRAKSATRMPASAPSIRSKLFDGPRNPEFLHELAQTYLDSGDYSMASAIYNRILEIDPKNSSAQAGVGVAFLYMNDLESGYRDLKKALQLDPKEPIALWNIAGLMNEFKFDKKRAQAIAAAKKTPKPKLLHTFAKKI